MDIKDVLLRIERLEEAVFGGTNHQDVSRGEQPNLKHDVYELFGRVKDLLQPYTHQYQVGDRMAMQAILQPAKDESHLTMHFQVTWLSKLTEDEDDADLAQLAGVLSSRQRVSILRRLTQSTLTSGELAELTGMAGGHLHHHVRSLMSLDLLAKTEDGKYEATERGISVYMTIASLYRGLSYDSRAGFREQLTSAIGDEQSE